jgi:hypothetical protein
MIHMTSSLWRLVVSAVLVMASLFVASCSDGAQTTQNLSRETRAPAVSPKTNVGSAPAVDPANLDPAAFVEHIDNPYMPFRPGSKWIYESSSGERIEVVVTPDRKMIKGIPAVVVRDTVTAGGQLVEDTLDWYAQDHAGNVWYMGEDTKEYENGKVVSTAGSWEAGTNGAEPGIIMHKSPPVGGPPYRQEYLRGEAEDMAQVIRLDGSAKVRYGSFDRLVVTREYTPLEPNVLEEKYYAHGVGSVLELGIRGSNQRVELVSFTPPGG